MSTTSQRKIVNLFEGDVDAQFYDSAADHSASPAQIELVDLSSGANTITPPTGARACTILFPAGNTVLVTLKGVTGDTGVVLHLTDPTSIGLNSAASTFCLNAASALTGLRLIWS